MARQTRLSRQGQAATVAPPPAQEDAGLPVASELERGFGQGLFIFGAALWLWFVVGMPGVPIKKPAGSAKK